MQKNIIGVYRSATGAQMREGIDWYPGLQEVARNSDKNLTKSVGVMAAISPLKSRKHLIGAVPKIFLSGTADKTGLGADKGDRILRGECPTQVLGGQLVLSLFDSIMYPHGDINPRLDKFSYEVAVGRKVERSEYNSGMRRISEEMSKAYREVALELNVSVPQLQAITWCVWRDTVYPNADIRKRSK